MSGAIVAQAINESIGTAGFQGLDAILKEYLGLIAEQAGTARVPISRTINGHSLASDVDLANNDVGAAPDGFGLGGDAKTVSDCHAIGKTGWYFTNSTAANRPALLGSSCLIHAKVNSNLISLEATDYNGNRAECAYINGWNEWEYVNPPMQVGVEYRTTERWNGKPVYTRLVYCGELPPVGNSKEVGIYKHGVTNVLEICGTMSTGDNLPYLNYEAYSTATPNSQINMTATNRNIKIATVAWRVADVAVTSITATARIKYVYG